jgi:CHAT domain-containing protein
MHAAALIDLLFENAAGKSLQRSISSLQMAERLADRPAPVLADLAAAYLVRAERNGAPRDLAAAIEAAEQALEREPGSLAARYNLALALERLDLLGEAAQEWRNYLAADGTSGWADEARRHLDQVLTAPTEHTPPAANAPLQAYAAYAAAEPQRARELGWCRTLGAWAGAALEGDAAGAEGHLRRAEALGTALERRPGGDATLADGVRAIRARAGRPDAVRLARAHREFAAGCHWERRVDFRAAEPRFRAAAADADGSPVLRAWARLHRGGLVFHRGDLRGGEGIVRPIVEAADSARHPALAARARLLLSVIAVRANRFDQALANASRARSLLRSAGERELEGAALEVLCIARVGLGDPDGGYVLAREGLERLRPYRASHRLHNLLGYISRTLGDDGFRRAAVRIQNDGVRVADRNGSRVYMTEARLWRARLLANRGAYAAAGLDVAAARSGIDSLANADPKVRGFLISRLQIAEATVRLRAHPAQAGRALDSAAAFFLDSMRSPYVAFPPIVVAANAWLAAGDAGRATDRLEAALAVLEQRRDLIRMEPRRAAVFEEARALVDRVTLLRLAAGRPDQALAYLDRGRASLAPAGAAVVPHTRRWVSAPPGEVAVAYALVADTLLTWTVAGHRVEVARTLVDTARLVRTIERLRRQFEERRSEAELRPGLSQLYELLVRPVQSRLGRAETPLVLVADGGLGAVPFPALYDSRRGRYLVEDHPLRFAVSLREARRPRWRREAAPATPVFVADPAFDARQHPGFPRLPGAKAEASQIAAGYRGARILAEARASGGAVRAALGRAGLVHYAGHAVFDDERPERSYLLLAPTPGDAAPATLQAAEIAGMDLRHLSLVVLSACQTVRTGPGRAAGFSGLAGAFLAAGAGGAVGSLWEVDDRLTRPLMIEFHRAYRASPNGSAALRAAQLHLLRSGDPALRSPAAWAAFRYAGT